MSIAWTTLSLLKPAIVQRLNGYAEMATEDAALWTRDLRRRLLGGAVALVSATLCLILGSAWILGAVWNTPWRVPVLAALLATFLVCAIVGAALAAWPSKPGLGPFARLRKQLGADLSLAGELWAPEGSRRTGRSVALGMLMHGGTSGMNGTFPRSAVMRLLLTLTGLARIFQ